MPAMYECLYVCCNSLNMYMYVDTVFMLCMCPLYNAKGIGDVALNKQISLSLNFK